MNKKRVIFVYFVTFMFAVAINISFAYYKDKYRVSFETGTNELIMSKYVSKNSKVIEPSKPEKDGYEFIEWQLDGEKYDFNNNVDGNIILTAKWIKKN